MMSNNKTSNDSSSVDKGLVAMVLRMSPEERLQANDNAASAILELRNAHNRQRKDGRSGRIFSSPQPRSSQCAYHPLARHFVLESTSF